MAELELRDLCKNFGQVRAVQNLNVIAADGEFVTLLGPSGCGKSTTLNLIAGLEKPTSGDIYLGGSRITDLPPNERGIGMVFQDYALYPHMSVFDNIAFSLKLRRVLRSEIERMVRTSANCSTSSIFWSGALRSYRAVNSSGWRWRGRWRSSLRSFCLTSRFPIWMLRSGCACARKSGAYTCSCRRRASS